jgi:hypothetical protein
MRHGRLELFCLVFIFNPFGEQASRLSIGHHKAVEGFFSPSNARAISTSFEGIKEDEAAILTDSTWWIVLEQFAGQVDQEKIKILFISILIFVQFHFRSRNIPG